jgi:hypothetical protein
MDWNIASSQSRIPISELPELHQKAVDLLDLLKKNLPDKMVKRASGILKRRTAFYTKCARSCCGTIQITARVKPQR